MVALLWSVNIMPSLEKVRWHQYSIPMRSPFVTAHGTIYARTGAIIEILGSEGLCGIGEIAPLPAFAGTTLDEALAPLSGLLAHLHKKSLPKALDALQTVSRDLPASTVYGVETALLDMLGQYRGQPIHRLLGSVGGDPHDRDPGAENDFEAHRLSHAHVVASTGIPVNAVISAATIDVAVKQAKEAVEAGYGCIKLKMGRGMDEEIERVETVRRAIGPAIDLRLDANEGWSFEQAVALLTRCAHLGLQYVEQPLPAYDLDGMHRLRQTVSVPLAGDEAVHDMESARLVLAQEAADVLIIKPQLVGGLRAGRQIIQKAAQQKVQSVITSTIEAGVGVVAALHLAIASSEVTLACGLATLSLLVDDLLTDDLSIRNGHLALPIDVPLSKTPGGLGVQLDQAALARYSIAMGEFS